MKKLLRIASVASLAIAFAAVVPNAHAADKTPVVTTENGQAVGTVVVPDGLKASDVQRAIVEAASGRGWTIRNKGDDGKVVVALEDGGWQALLNIVFDAKQVQIFSKSTKKGKPSVPDTWVKFIKQDITKNLNTKAFLK